MSYQEQPLNLKQQIAFRVVADAVADHEENGSLKTETLDKFQAKLPEFVAMQARGSVKRKARIEFASGEVLVIHFWEDLFGNRSHLKLK
jgi:hypothetical protein